MPALPLKLVDCSQLFTVVEEQDVFPSYLAMPVLPHAICGKLNGVDYELAHLTLQGELQLSSRMSHFMRRRRGMHVPALKLF